MKNTENKNYEGFYTEDGWWICQEDDVYNDLYNELFGDTDLSDALLEDTFRKDLTSPLAFVFAYIPWKPGSTLADADDHEKRPAMLLFRLASEDGYYAFQLTTSKGSGWFDQFKFELAYPGRYRLWTKDKKPSYINYSHLVKIKDQNLLRYLGRSLSYGDCKALYKCLTEQYTDLSAINDHDSMSVYNRLIKMLEAHLAIADEDSFLAKKKTDDKKSDEKKSDEKKTDDKKTGEKKADEKKLDNKKSDDKKSDNKKTDTTAEAKPADATSDTTVKAEETVETEETAKTADDSEIKSK